MRNAFTMLELIMVILVVAILSVVMLPRFTDDKLREAADQILSHIRYTQHLAMIDDRFDPTDQNWTRERWQISFRNCASSTSDWYYVVGRDLDHSGAIGTDESAVNPADGKHLFVLNTCDPSADQSSQILLTSRFGITGVSFTSSCGDNRYVAFDQTGRPYRSTLGVAVHDLVRTTCGITFVSSDGNFTIGIEPETGYARLTSINY